MDLKKSGNHELNRRSFLGGSVLGSVGASLLSTSGFSVLRAAGKSSSAASAVETTCGKIRGAASGKTIAFKGVPYGASTEGARFLPPSKAQSWSGVRECLNTGRRRRKFLRR